MNVKSENIPVYIDGKIYQHSDFVTQINEGYQQGQREHGDYRRGRPIFESYIDTVQLDKKNPQKMIDSDGADCDRVRYGFAYWVAQFDRFITTASDRYFSVEDHNNTSFNKSSKKVTALAEYYIQEVLVKKLKAFVDQFYLKNTFEFNRIVDYKSYLFACIELQYYPKYEMCWLPASGWGVYVLEDIHPFTFLGLYGGILKSRRLGKAVEFFRGYANRYKWSTIEAPQYLIDAEKKGSLLRFINHDCKRTRRAEPFVFANQWNIPGRGLIAGTPERKRYSHSLSTFETGDEVVWAYGYDVHVE